MALELHTHVTDELRAEVLEFLSSFSPSDVVCGEHDPVWLRILHDGLGHKPCLMLHRTAGGTVDGYLPLAWVRSRFFGRFLVSLPYLNRAGVVAKSVEIEQALVSMACDLARDNHAKYLELRHDGRSVEHDRLSITRSEKSRMVLTLADDAEALWKGLTSKVRNQVRKGERSHPALRMGGEDLVEPFHKVFATTMRDLGTPVYPRRLFSSILHHLGSDAELVLVDIDDQPVAGALLIHDRLSSQSITQVPSAACLRSANPTCANMWMYHQLLERAIVRGSAQFDFGRSSETSGTWKFKKQWGAQPIPSRWQMCSIQGDVDIARPDNPKYQKRIETWQKLPVWVTRLIGPTIVRGIP